MRKKAILVGGVMNLLGALFHVWLCVQIFKAYGGKPFYPLMQMLSIGGTLLIFFLAATSLFCGEELLRTFTGRLVLVLNVALYSARIVGELLLFPKPSPTILGVCVLFCAVYLYIWTGCLNDTKKAAEPGATDNPDGAQRI